MIGVLTYGQWEGETRDRKPSNVYNNLLVVAVGAGSGGGGRAAAPQLSRNLTLKPHIFRAPYVLRMFQFIPIFTLFESICQKLSVKEARLLF